MIRPKAKKQLIEKRAISSRKCCELVFLTFCCLIFGYVFVSCSRTKETSENKVVEPVQSPSETPLVEIDPNADFSKFTHTNPQHERMPCELCHVREDNSPKPKFSSHLTCSGCHVQQFADKKSAICTICHTNPESGEMKSFPTLQNFNASFDHKKHLRQTNCATCHKPERNGVSKSILSRNNSHQTCFQCHSPEAESGGVNIGSCQTCHQLGNPPRAITKSRKAFKVNFNHSKHNMSCTNCHQIKAGSNRGNQVTAPIASMHFPPKNTLSCATCHNNKRAFGGDDFSDCKRCHKGNDFNFP